MNRKTMFGPALSGLWLVLLAVLAFRWPLLAWPMARPLGFVVAVALLVLEFAAIGVCISGRAAGVIIDSRNCMSLSKLQACGWTVIVLAALLVAAAFNLSLGRADALAIKIPSDLLVAMGISAASLAAAPAVLSLKSGETPSAGAVQAAANQLSTPAAPVVAATVPRVGKMITNGSISDANWTDMLTGDEVGNFANPDLSKIQQLLVTLLLLGVYSVMIWRAFAVAGPLKALPPLDESFIWLLGVSHASYIAYKAAPHTTSGPAPAV
jgi:hypothetical protein